MTNVNETLRWIIKGESIKISGSYRRLPIENPRTFIMLGTTSRTDYLPQDQSTRRFWPMQPLDKDMQIAQLKADLRSVRIEAGKRIAKLERELNIKIVELNNLMDKK